MKQENKNMDSKKDLKDSTQNTKNTQTTKTNETNHTKDKENLNDLKDSTKDLESKKEIEGSLTEPDSLQNISKELNKEIADAENLDSNKKDTKETKDKESKESLSYDRNTGILNDLNADFQNFNNDNNSEFDKQAKILRDIRRQLDDFEQKLFHSQGGDKTALGNVNVNVNSKDSGCVDNKNNNDSNDSDNEKEKKKKKGILGFLDKYGTAVGMAGGLAVIGGGKLLDDYVFSKAREINKEAEQEAKEIENIQAEINSEAGILPQQYPQATQEELNEVLGEVNSLNRRQQNSYIYNPTLNQNIDNSTKQSLGNAICTNKNTLPYMISSSYRYFISITLGEDLAVAKFYHYK